jgi:hypothetical protein
MKTAQAEMVVDKDVTKEEADGETAFIDNAYAPGKNVCL